MFEYIYLVNLTALYKNKLILQRQYNTLIVSKLFSINLSQRVFYIIHLTVNFIKISTTVTEKYVLQDLLSSKDGTMFVFLCYHATFNSTATTNVPTFMYTHKTCKYWRRS